MFQISPRVHDRTRACDHRKMAGFPADGKLCPEPSARDRQGLPGMSLQPDRHGTGEAGKVWKAEPPKVHGGIRIPAPPDTSILIPPVKAILAACEPPVTALRMGRSYRKICCLGNFGFRLRKWQKTGHPGNRKLIAEPFAFQMARPWRSASWKFSPPSPKPAR
jgi:hypothetical protein